MISYPVAHAATRLLSLRWPCVFAVISLLQACGGGGGGSAPASQPASGNAVVFSPATLNTGFVEGDEAWVEVTMTLRATLSGTVVARIVDNVGVIQANPQITALSADTYQARFQLNPGLAVGAHTGQLLLQLCKDDACAEQHPGSPWSWPYTVQVASGTHLTPLAPLTGGADWTTFQGGFGHSGFAPMALDATKFTRRWTWVPPVTDPKFGATVGANTLQPVAVSQGQVFVSTGSAYLRDRLYALNESDGGVAWQSGDLTLTQGQANPPTVVGDRVLLSTSGQMETALMGFDRATGSSLFNIPFPTQWSRYYAPVVVGQQVLNLGGYSGGLLGFDLGNGSPTWAQTSYLGYDQSTPAADDSFAYALVARSCNTCDDAGLGVIDPATGELAWRVAVPGIGYANESLSSAPVLADGVVYLYDGSATTGPARQLFAFSLAQRSVLWQATGAYFASPVVGNGAVYAALANPERIEARDAANGARLWTWVAPTTVAVPAGQVPPPATYAYQGCHSCLVLAGNLLFYSAANQVHAIDLTSHASVWTFPRPGDLSLSANGTLFIASTQGPGVGAWLTAVNLR